MSRRAPLSARLTNRVNYDAAGGCWEFTGSATVGGYGQIETRAADGRRKGLYTHRVMFELMVGPIPDGLQLDHLCRNRRCCNPDHLEPVTQRENLIRGEGFANRALATHCDRGHAFDADNTYIRNGGRSCKTCKRAARLRSDAARKAVQA